ncbi:hypothetical protein ACDA63_07095 [Uliginosibacterium sp. sgz301328]|uniref:hypothetical protein n=1 Tax=Uliginosibacterium sp. sgz301328 TaxID=3243764 RepID=UPI00359EBCDB
MFALYVEQDKRFAFSDVDNGGKKITTEAYKELFDAQAEGKIIVRGADGMPSIATPPAPTDDEVVARQISFVQSLLDEAARELGYDSIASAISYADEPSVAKFQEEGIAFRRWRSMVWAHCYQVLADVKAGKRTTPSPDELRAELPKLAL